MNERVEQVIAGACRACGRDLVHVIGERTYHPARVLAPEDLCPALLPYPGTTTISFNVPDDQFIWPAPTQDRGTGEEGQQ